MSVEWSDSFYPAATNAGLQGSMNKRREKHTDCSLHTGSLLIAVFGNGISKTLIFHASACG